MNNNRNELILELYLNAESQIAKTWLHKVVDTLEVSSCRSCCFRIERSFVVDHPQVAPNERYIYFHYIVEPFVRQGVTYRYFLQTNIGGFVDVI